jgi:hypothetical protein
VLGVDAEPQGQFNRLVEFGELHLLQKGNRLFDRVRSIFDLRGCGSEFLAVLCQQHLQVVQTDPAGPPTIDESTNLRIDGLNCGIEIRQFVDSSIRKCLRRR